MRVPIRPELCAVMAMFALTGVAASPALAGEAHPMIEHTGFETDTFTNPNGIAVDESTGDVYVADIGTATVYKFSGEGNPVDFSSLGSNALNGSATPAKSFSFPSERGNLAAVAVDNSTAPSDPSAGDLYVLDAGHDVIDKFNPSGAYIGQITGAIYGQAVGVGVDASGEVRVYTTTREIYVYDHSPQNAFVKSLHPGTSTITREPANGFAVSPNDDMYTLESCGCLEKRGGNLEPLGRVDGGPSDIAVAVDPVTGHVYVDEQSAITEWDTGGMNGQLEEVSTGEGTDVSTGALVSTFGSAQLSVSSEQGGIAVDGASGDVYVSNPADGKVYVFASDVPGVAAGHASNLTTSSAMLHGTVDPYGAAVMSCEFEYEKVTESGGGEFRLRTPVSVFTHSAPCAQEPGQIGSGTSTVEVSADVGGLVPGALYDFRLVAGNAHGTSPSEGRFAAAGPGFGFKHFEVAFLNTDGSPDTQAGSHPYKMVTTIDLNTAVIQKEKTADSVYVTMPDGNARDIIADLPPGFVGDPNATAKKCTLQQLEGKPGENGGGGHCPAESQIGELEVEFGENAQRPIKEPVYNMVPPPGVALQIGANFVLPNVFINVGVRAGADYPVQAGSLGISAIEPLVSTRLTIRGVVGKTETGQGEFGGNLNDTRKAFLTLPTGCTGPLRSSVSADSWQNPGHFIEPPPALTRNSAGQPVALTGCSKLSFPPTISVTPDTTDASTSSGLTVGVHVSQKGALNPEGLAESTLRDTTVTLPEGVTINPSGSDGLEACTAGEGALGGALGSPGDQIGFEGWRELNENYEKGVQTATFTPEIANPLQPGANFCPDGSKIATVKIRTPLLPNPLEGAVYLATQNANPFGSLLAMYLVAEDPVSGSLIKLPGEVRLCESAGQVIESSTCRAPGQIVTTFKNTPELPFEELELHFFGGERAPLSTPSRCGTYTTIAVFTPWDGNGPVTAESSFNIEHGPGGGPCPGASLPFNPTVSAGATNIQAGAFSPLTVTMNRKDGEQNLKSIVAKLPPGLSGVLTGVELCPEPRANEGLCGENSKVGEATVSVGVGNQPFTVTGGKFYLTGPYNGSGGCTVGEAGCAPFGLTFEVPAKAGPFDLKRNTANPAGEDACDCVVVRGKIELNPLTSAITITTDPPGSPDSIPTSIEGIPLEIQHVNATTTRGDFQFNPTNCAKMALEGTVQLSEGGTSTISTPFQVTNCAALKFEPKFSVSTSGKTSKAKGASLTAKLTYPNVPQGTDADIAKVKVELPKQLPSRLTTLQKACTDKQFEANPAACPSESKIGYATVHTPLIPVPLAGPVIFVSHGGEAFPSLTMVLQGYGITIDLVGTTFISKAGVTSTTFKTVPDQPFSSFELTLPEGEYSALSANANLCSLTKTVTVKKKVMVRVKGRKQTVTRKVKETQPATLAMPTEFVAQNGAEIHQTTPISVTGCAKAVKKKTTKKGKHKAHKKGKGKK